MGTRITQRTLGSIEPTGKPYFIRDTTLPGFGLKVTAKGKASYFVEARVKGGRVVRKNIGDAELVPLDDARDEARGMLRRLKQGVDIARERPPAPPEPQSLTAVLDRYLTIRTGLRETTRHDYYKVLHNAFPGLLSQSVETITKEDVASAYAPLVARTSPAYAKKALRTLKAVLNSADLTRNPVSQFLKSSGVTTVAPSRIRFLSSGEIAAIMALQGNAFGDLLLFYLLTGCRRNEALSLEARDYSLADNTLTFRITKNGRPHTIPAEGWIRGIVDRRLAENPTGRLWPYSEGTFRTKFDKARVHLRFQSDWTVHDLRRTFAEHCQLIGVDVSVIASALNHTPVGVTATSYLGGGLAKREMLKDVYRRLQQQYSLYYSGYGEERFPEGAHEAL